MSEPLTPASEVEALGTAASDEAQVRSVEFSEQSGAGVIDKEGNLDLILDINVPVIVRLGEAEMSIDDILALAAGSVVELNRLASDPVDVLVRDKLIARGEVVLVDENFGVRITNILTVDERISTATSTS